MAEVKHTRWEVEDYGSPGDLEGVLSRYAVLDSGGVPIAYALTPSEARLIAAAPDLFEALEGILNTSGARKSGYDAFEYSKAVALAENALSKATAQQEGR